MRFIKKNKYVIFFIALCIVSILLTSFLVFEEGLKNIGSTYSHNNYLRHERSYSSKKSLTNFTEEESEQIITTFGIIVPETENNITVHSFTLVDLNGIGEEYIVEIDNVSNREALYEANNNTKKPEKLYLPLMWNFTNRNGEYRYYFCFTTSGYYPLDGYVNSVSQLYEMLSK